MDAEKDKGRTGRLLHLAFIVMVSFGAIVTKPPGHLKGIVMGIPAKLYSDSVAEWNTAMNQCYAKLDVSESPEKCHPFYGWHIGTMQGAFLTALLAITGLYVRGSDAVSSDRAVLNFAEDIMLLMSVNLLGLSFTLRYMVLYGANSFMAFPGHMFFIASMWGFMVVACFIAIRRTRREQANVSLEWDRARGGRLLLLSIVFAASWPAIFLSPPGLFKDTGYMSSSDPLADWKVSLKECYDNLATGQLVAICHPYYELYALSMIGAFSVSLLSILVSHFHRFGSVAMDTTVVIFRENVLLLIGVNSLGLGFYLRQLVLFGERSFIAIPEQMFFVVSLWVVLNIAPVMCLLASWRGLHRGGTCKLPFHPKATKASTVTTDCLPA